jgi:PKD repeat protein
MKKIFSLLIIVLAVTFSIQAQTITVHVSGTVVRDSTHAPVDNHEVIIQADSNSYGFTFYATRHTDPNGFYDCTITNVPSSGQAMSFMVQTKNCDSTWLVQNFIGTVAYDTVNFVICNGNNAGCQASFTYYVDTTSPGTLVYFYDQSTPTGNISSWSWNFGDGSPTSNLQNPSHMYTTTGTYTVCLTIETSTSCTSTFCYDVQVGYTECHAYYTYSIDTTNLLHVHFVDASTPQNLIISRHWDFGDPASGLADTSNHFDPWHTFTQAGVYDVCLTIGTSNGCTSTYCDTIMVGNNPTNCENWFTYTSSGLTVNFEGHTHSPYPTTYNWNFGDPQSGSNNVSSLKNPVHVFTASGNYTITLNTVDSTSCSWTRTQTISINVTCNLYGYVHLGDSLYVDHGLAELMKVDSGVVTIVDSVQFGDSLGYYWFGGVLPGHYYIQASLLPSSQYYGQYVPTYYVSAVNWGDAVLIELGQPNNPYNIHMHHASNYSSGNGNITGTINQSGKFTPSGTPAANVEVLLMDVSGNILAFTMTNSSGEFNFTNMAMGTYKVYPEMILKTTTPTTVTLDATHAGANVVFTIQGSNISGIHDLAYQPDFTISNIYPNPVSDMINFTIHAQHVTGITVAIYSITGELVVETPFSLHTGANKITIPASDLRNGLYYIKVEKQDGSVLAKKFVVGR